MAYYRKEFPSASVIPKMHILEDHVVPWVERWGIGAGLMGEQGAESLHAHIHNLETTKYSNTKNKVEQLKCLVDMYNLETCPELLSLTPDIKERRKRKRED